MQAAPRLNGIMKCLSVCQPFADLILSGAKTIELRRWNTRHRGDMLIHAPRKIRRSDCKRLGVGEICVTGAIMGKVRLVDVKKYNNAVGLQQDYPRHLAGTDFVSCRYGFVLADAQRFKEPIPYKGKLGLYQVDEYLEFIHSSFRKQDDQL